MWLYPITHPTQTPGPVVDNVLSPVLGDVVSTSLDHSVQPLTQIRPPAYSFGPIQSRSATADATTADAVSQPPPDAFTVAPSSRPARIKRQKRFYDADAGFIC